MVVAAEAREGVRVMAQQFMELEACPLRIAQFLASTYIINRQRRDATYLG
jgi:hypothetical protein